MQFNTVGELRNMLKHLQDDQIMYGQVIASDKTTWYMSLNLHISEHLVTIDLTHPDLLTLVSPLKNHCQS